MSAYAAVRLGRACAPLQKQTAGSRAAAWRARRWPGWFVVLLLLVSFRSAAALFDDDVARRQIADLKKDLAAQASVYTATQRVLDERLAGVDERLGRVGDRLGRLDERLGYLESGLRDRVVDLVQLIDGLKQDMARLRGQIEVAIHQAETIERRQKDLYVDVESRMRRLEQTFNEKILGPEREVRKEKDAYEAALNQFKIGNFQASIAAFQTFMVNYPKSQFVPSAQYWIGNAYYSTRDYRVAILTQEKLVATWPDNAKAPDAMLNIASAQAELGDQKAARETLGVLMKRYPGSPAAELAKQRLQKR